jgi:FdhD protein
MEAQKFSIVQISEQSRVQSQSTIATEFSLTIILDNRELVTLLCSPTKLDCLAVGFLSSEGLLKSKDEIKSLTVDDRKGIARVETKGNRGPDNELLFKRRYITSGGGTVKGASFHSAASIEGQGKIESRLVIAPRQVFKLVDEFQNYSQLFQTSRGVHSAALCDTENILVFADDLGRHNAIDKIFGECLLKDMPTNDRIVITTGRVPSEQLLKVARRNVPIMVSLTVPTDLGVRLAADYGITLIGSVKGKKMNVYTGDWRLKPDDA